MTRNQCRFLIMDLFTDSDFIMKLQKLTALLLMTTFSSTSILLALSSDPAQARERDNDCSNKTLNGDYGFQDAGTRKADGATVSYDAVRTANFNGRGKHVGTGFVSIDGTIVGYTVTGTYAVKSDCTFTMDATQTYADGRPSQPYKQFGVVVRGGKEVLEVQTTEGKNQAGKYQEVVNY